MRTIVRMEQHGPRRVEGLTAAQREARAGVILDAAVRLGTQGTGEILRELRGEPGMVRRWETVRAALPLIERLHVVLSTTQSAGERIVDLFEALEAMRNAAMVQGRVHLPLAEFTTALRHVAHAAADMVEHGLGGENLWNEMFLSTPAPARDDMAAAYVCRLARTARTHQIATGGDLLYEMVVRRDPRDATYTWLERTVRSARRLEQGAGLGVAH